MNHKQCELDLNKAVILQTTKKIRWQTVFGLRAVVFQPLIYRMPGRAPDGGIEKGKGHTPLL